MRINKEVLWKSSAFIQLLSFNESRQLPQNARGWVGPTHPLHLYIAFLTQLQRNQGAVFSFLPKGGRTQPLLCPLLLELKIAQGRTAADAPAFASCWCRSNPPCGGIPANCSYLGLAQHCSIRPDPAQPGRSSPPLPKTMASTC